MSRIILNNLNTPVLTLPKPYSQQKLTYVNGKLLDERGNAVMMDWEDEIMKHQAATICKNGGDVLNIGFGMGIIDSYIQEYKPSTHWIIESHPDVQKKMIEDGWLKKPNVKVIFKSWQEVINYLPKFDGIYYDTWEENAGPFLRKVKDLLKPEGVFTFFNNPRLDDYNIGICNFSYDILKEFMNYTLESFEISNINPKSHQRTDGDFYWDPNWKTYHNPSFTLKPEFK